MKTKEEMSQDKVRESIELLGGVMLRMAQLMDENYFSSNDLEYVVQLCVSATNRLVIMGRYNYDTGKV